LNILKERGFLKAGDIVVNTGSTPVSLHLPTNVLKITKVKDEPIEDASKV
jgi:pyruvate kinase